MELFHEFRARDRLKEVIALRSHLTCNDDSERISNDLDVDNIIVDRVSFESTTPPKTPRIKESSCCRSQVVLKGQKLEVFIHPQHVIVKYNVHKHGHLSTPGTLSLH